MAFVLGGAGLAVASLTVDAPAALAPAPPAATPPAAVVPDAPASDRAPAPAAVTALPDPPAPRPLPIVPDPQIAIIPTPPAPVQPEPPAAAPIVAAPPAAPAVRINRPGADPAPVAVEDSISDEIPLLRYAADFDYAADLPLVAVILHDDPAHADAPALIADLPFVPTVVLDVGAPDVTARMRAYRALGIEVLVSAALPQMAQPSDVQITYQAAFDLVPDAVALFSDGTGPETTGTIATQLLQLLAEDGRGYVTVPRGLGSMRPVTAGEVPLAQVGRDVDGTGETQDLIARNLAQAAFRARQTGEVVVLGRATPETLAAISTWANRSDPGQVSLVPVSAVLISQLPPP